METRYIYYFFKPELTEGQTMSNYRMIQVNINGEEVDFYSCGGPIQELGNTPFSTAIETIKANPNTLSGEFGIGCTNGGLENYYPTFKYNFETEQVTVNIDNE